MAAKKKVVDEVSAVTESVREILQFAVDGTASPQGFAFLFEKQIKQVLEEGPDYLLVDANVKNPQGAMAVQATQKAVDFLTLRPTAVFPTAATPAQFQPEAVPELRAVKPPPPVVLTPKGSYPILNNVPIPFARRGPISGSKYPFAGLEVGQAFFVPLTELPKGQKTLISAVSNRNRKAKKEGSAVRYTFRAYTFNDVQGFGVWRAS